MKSSFTKEEEEQMFKYVWIYWVLFFGIVVGMMIIGKEYLRKIRFLWFGAAILLAILNSFVPKTENPIAIRIMRFVYVVLGAFLVISAISNFFFWDEPSTGAPEPPEPFKP